MPAQAKVTKPLLLLVGPDFVGFLHSGDAPWARRQSAIHGRGGSRGIHAARPAARHLRSACTQVAFCGVWAIALEKQRQKQDHKRHACFLDRPVSAVEHRFCGSEPVGDGLDQNSPFPSTSLMLPLLAFVMFGAGSAGKSIILGGAD